MGNYSGWKGHACVLVIAISLTVTYTLYNAFHSAWGSGNWLIPAGHPEVWLIVGTILLIAEIYWFIRTARRKQQ